MLFSGRATPQLAADIADKLGVELGPVTLKTFSNGEVYCRYEESIRGADVFIVQSTCGNPQTGMTANDALMELLLMIDAAVGASAHRVIAVMPWFGYSRQDKKSAPREPICARLVARMLEAAGADRVLTMDLHAGQVQGFFRSRVDHMTARFILAQHFADLPLEDLVVVAPDAGRVEARTEVRREDRRRPRDPDKERPAQQVAEIGYVIGDVKGKTAVIVDDIIDTAGTLVRRRRDRCSSRAPTRVYAAATHGVFSGDAFENLASAPFERDRRHRHDPDPRRPRPTTSSCSRAPSCSPTRSGGSSPTARSARCSAARTSCSEPRRLGVTCRAMSGAASTSAPARGPRVWWRGLPRSLRRALLGGTLLVVLVGSGLLARYLSAENAERPPTSRSCAPRRAATSGRCSTA